MTPPGAGREIDLVQLSVPAMEALVAGDLDRASQAVGATLTPYVVEESWLWRIRLAQVAADPEQRRRGYATAMLRRALEWAASEPGVRTVRASISPENVASLATLRPFGFRRTGEQWDDEDGLELVFEREVTRRGL